MRWSTLCRYRQRGGIRHTKKTFDLFLNMSGWYVGEYSGKATVESCLIIILISMSLVNNKLLLLRNILCQAHVNVTCFSNCRWKPALAMWTCCEYVACYAHGWDHPTRTSHTVRIWPFTWRWAFNFWAPVVLHCHDHHKLSAHWFVLYFPNFPRTATTIGIICKHSVICMCLPLSHGCCCRAISIRVNCACATSNTPPLTIRCWAKWLHVCCPIWRAWRKCASSIRIIGQLPMREAKIGVNSSE